MIGHVLGIHSRFACHASVQARIAILPGKVGSQWLQGLDNVGW
jgi:hypothetical protein